MMASPLLQEQASHRKHHSISHATKQHSAHHHGTTTQALQDKSKHDEHHADAAHRRRQRQHVIISCMCSSSHLFFACTSAPFDMRSSKVDVCPCSAAIKIGNFPSLQKQASHRKHHSISHTTKQQSAHYHGTPTGTDMFIIKIININTASIIVNFNKSNHNCTSSIVLRVILIDIGVGLDERFHQQLISVSRRCVQHAVSSECRASRFCVIRAHSNISCSSPFVCSCRARTSVNQKLQTHKRHHVD
jgi:hypothetical protein